MDCSLPGSSVHGILQARILEWVAIPFSRGSSQPRDVCICITDWLCYTPGTINNTQCLKTISLLPTSLDAGEWPYAILPSAKLSSCQPRRQDRSERAELQGKCTTWAALNTGHGIRDLSKMRKEKSCQTSFPGSVLLYKVIWLLSQHNPHPTMKASGRKFKTERGSGKGELERNREMDFYWLQLCSPRLAVNGEALTSSVACSAAPAESLWTVCDNLKRPRQTRPAGWLVLPAAQVENDSMEARAWVLFR